MPDDAAAPGDPGQDPQLAELLDACLRAERLEPGGAARIIEAAPPHLRPELEELLRFAQRLQRNTWVGPSEAFRAGARARLQAQIESRRSQAARPIRRGLTPWLVRAAAAIVALSVMVYAAASAAARALPDEPLYGIKQARELLAVELAGDDSSRALVLVDQAGVRLDECTRLTHAGRTELAATSAEQYVATLDRAITALVGARPAPEQQAREQFDAAVREQRQQLSALAAEAPAALRPALGAAIAAADAALDRSSQLSQGTPLETPASPTAGVGASRAASPAASPSPQRLTPPSAVASPSPVR
jgi:hypothetical protein